MSFKERKALNVAVGEFVKTVLLLVYFVYVCARWAKTCLESALQPGNPDPRWPKMKRKDRRKHYFCWFFTCCIISIGHVISCMWSAVFSVATLETNGRLKRTLRCDCVCVDMTEYCQETPSDNSPTLSSSSPFPPPVRDWCSTSPPETRSSTSTTSSIRLHYKVI